MHTKPDIRERPEGGSWYKQAVGWVRANAILIAVALLVSTAGIGALGVVALTPDHELPVGTALTSDRPILSGSMGYGEQKAVLVYADVEPEVGDSILFTYDPWMEEDKSSEELVHHRIVGTTDDRRYITQGDANPHTDQSPEGEMGLEPVDPSDVRGVVVLAISLTDAITGLLGLLAFLGLLGGALYRRRLVDVSRRSLQELRNRRPARGKVRAIALVAVIVLSVVAMPFMAVVGPIEPDHDGTVAAAETLNVTEEWNKASSNIVDAAANPDGGAAYLQDTDDVVTEYAISDGTTGWTDSATSFDGGVEYMNGYVYHASRDGDFAKLDAADGSRVTTITTSAYDLKVGNGNVYSAEGNLVEYTNGDLTSSTTLSSRNIRAISYDANTSTLVGWDNSNGVIVGFGLDGTEKYTQNIGPSLDDNGELAAAKGYVYHRDGNGDVVKREADTGANVSTIATSGSAKYLDDGPAGGIWVGGNNNDVTKIDPDGSTVSESTGLGGTYGIETLVVYDGPNGIEFVAGATDVAGRYSTDLTTSEPVSGTVTDTAGNAQSGVTVEAKDGSGSVVDSVSTDSNGDYELGVPEPATYEITANDGDHSSTKTVDVPSGGKTGVDFEIGPTVTGKVTDGDGNVLENVAVGADDSSVETDYTNATGEYELLFPGTGTYEITADDGDYVSTKTVDVTTGGVSGINFRLGPGNPNGQPVGLLEDDYGIFPADDTELVVYERSTEYKSVEEGMSVRTWHEETWTKTETATFNWENRTHVDLVHGRYYRLELDSSSGSWEDSGFLYNDTEMSGSTIWLEPDPSSTDTNGDGTTGGSGSSGTNARDYDSTTPTADENGTYPTATEQQGFGPTALGTCTAIDGQDGVEVEYWDPNYETAELEANLTVDGSTTYYIHKYFDDPRGYYRGCIADSMTDNASSERSDLGFNHTALDEAGNEISTGSTSWSAPTFGPTGKAPESTGERLGLLAGVLGALGVLWVGGNKVVPASSVRSWPSETINPAFGIGAPVVGVLGLDLAGGGVISAGVATGLAQIAPFAGIVGVTVGGYYALRWIRAPPS